MHAGAQATCIWRARLLKKEDGSIAIVNEQAAGSGWCRPAELLGACGQQARAETALPREQRTFFWMTNEVVQVKSVVVPDDAVASEPAIVVMAPAMPLMRHAGLPMLPVAILGKVISLVITGTGAGTGNGN